MKHVQFAISWIYEEFRVARIARGELAEVWQSSEPVSSLAAFHEALIKASTALKMNSGGDVAIAFESDDHSHAFLDLPPMNRRDVERYLERRVDQEKAFEGRAVWSYRTDEDNEESRGVLLHVMPKSVLDAIIRICQENHLTPMRLLPLTDVMAQHVPDVYESADEVILVAALFEERVEIVVTSDRGEILFVRELKYHWRDESLERFRVDIERTVLYVKQRQRSVDRISLVGSESKLAARVLQTHVSFPVDVDDDGLEPYFWAKSVAGLRNDTTSNFIPKTVQRTAARQKAVRTASWLAVAATLCAIAVTGWVEYLIFEQGRRDPIIEQNIAALTARRDALQAQVDRVALLELRLTELSPQYPAVPAWFLSRIGELIPDQAILRSVELAWVEERWEFSLEGATTPTLASSAETLAEFEQRLSDDPWKATVSDDWRVEWFDQLRLGKAANTGLLGFTFRGDLF